MANATLVKQDLTQDMVSAGADLVRALDKSGISVTAAFWLFFGDEPDWRLMIVSPEAVQLGPLAFYRKLGEQMRALNRPELNSSNVTAVAPDDRIVAALRKVVRLPGIGSMRYTGNVFNGLLIPDALVYRST